KKNTNTIFSEELSNDIVQIKNIFVKFYLLLSVSLTTQKTKTTIRQFLKKLKVSLNFMTTMTDRRNTTANTGFASGGVKCKLGALCFNSSVVLADSYVLRNPPERKARNRYKTYTRTSVKQK